MSEPLPRAAPLSLTAEQSRALDAALTARLTMPSLLLMENAGRGAADVIDARYGPATRSAVASPPRAVVFCGPGNNGGDGLVVARHLLGRGWRVLVFDCGGDRPRVGDAAVMHAIVTALAQLLAAPARCELASVRDESSARTAAARVDPDDLVVDALLGTGSRGEPRAPLATLLSALASTPRRAGIALDLPTGIDADDGRVVGAAFRADLTLTFAAPKPGLARGDAIANCGEIVVIDLGVPREAIARLVTPPCESA